MRILTVTADFPPSVGGMQIYSWELARAWAKWASAFAVLAPKHEASEATDSLADFPVHRVRYAGDSFALSGTFSIRKVMRDMIPDAVFATSWACASGVLRAQSLGAPEVPIFTAAHGRELVIRPFDKHRYLPLQSIYDRLRFDALDRSTVIFPVSEFTGDLLRVRGVRNEKIHVVPNGVDPEKYHPKDASDLRDRLGLRGRKVLLTVGRLVERKGIDTVIDAMPKLIQAVPDLVYVIVGDGPDRARIESLVEGSPARESIWVVGRVPAEDILDYYNLCDVFVMPSRTDGKDVEGFGLVFFEASACGKPVVGARSGGVLDAIVENQTGLLVPPGDSDALRDALEELLLNPVRARKMGDRGRVHVLENGTWEQAARRIFDVMRSTCGRSRGRTSASYE